MTPPSGARDLKALLEHLGDTGGVQGALLVAPDGLVIASAMRQVLPVEAISALAATLGRELETRSITFDEGGPGIAQFAAERGTLLVGSTAIGFVAVLAGDTADRARLSAQMRETVTAIQQTWGAPATA